MTTLVSHFDDNKNASQSMARIILSQTKEVRKTSQVISAYGSGSKTGVLGYCVIPSTQGLNNHTVSILGVHL